jgi:hypothetical protein
MKSCITVLMMALALTATVNARPNQQQQKRFELDFYGQVFQQQSKIFLKQEIKKIRPNFNPSKWDLKRVVLVAKSAAGFGQAYLQTGRDQSRVETVDGNRPDFRSNGNYHRVVFPAPGQDQGNWQIHMQGRIKVKKVNLILVKKQPRRPNVTRKCSYVLETVWGKDIRKFHAQAQGPKGSGVAAKACKKAYNKCNRLQNEIPLTKCNKL